jgi:regulatory protein YycI of two-component signal transduction system YycFG
VLQQLEEERRQAEETKLYIGDVSLEDILDQGPEKTAPIEQIQQEASQASLGLSSEEAKLYIGTENQLKMTSKEKFPLSDDDSSEDIDTILKEALEEYEDQLPRLQGTNYMVAKD